MSSALAGRFASAHRGKLREFEDRCFTPRNLRMYGLAWVASNAVTLAWFFLRGSWPFASKTRPSDCIDFGWMWITGRFAASGDPARIYDYASFATAQTNLFGVGNCVLLTPFVYPPTLLFFTYPFGRLPFVAAFVLWNALLLLLFVVAIYLIVRRANAIIGALTLRPLQVDLYVGHNGLLTTGLMGSTLLLLERKPLLAGFFLALLTYKPQFGLLFPVALLASRNWRALGSATAFSLAFAAAAALAFGSDSWFSFVNSLFNRNSGLSPDPAVQLPLMSIYGLLQSSGLGPRLALAAHVAVALVLVAAVWIVWSKPMPFPVRAAMLCVGSLLASPYVLSYDFCVLAIAFAFLMEDGLARGFLPGERIAMLFCGTVLLSAGLRAGPIMACAVLLWLIWRRIAMLRVQEARV